MANTHAGESSWLKVKARDSLTFRFRPTGRPRPTLSTIIGYHRRFFRDVDWKDCVRVALAVTDGKRQGRKTEHVLLEVGEQLGKSLPRMYDYLRAGRWILGKCRVAYA